CHFRLRLTCIRAVRLTPSTRCFDRRRRLRPRWASIVTSACPRRLIRPNRCTGSPPPHHRALSLPQRTAHCLRGEARRPPHFHRPRLPPTRCRRTLLANRVVAWCWPRLLVACRPASLVRHPGSCYGRRCRCSGLPAGGTRSRSRGPAIPPPLTASRR